METACWSLASWKEGLELDLRGKSPTAAGGWPGAGPGQPGAGGAARGLEQGGFQHVGFAAGQLGWQKAEDAEDAGAG